MKPLIKIFYSFACASGIVFIQACNSTPAAIPFPEHETEFSQPVSMPYKFSEPKKIKWEIPNPDSIKTVTETKLDFNKLPSEPFDIGDFRPFRKPMEARKFDLNDIPDTVFDLNKLPTRKFTFKVSLLGQPIRTKATPPRIRDKATRSIFQYGIDQGLSTGGITISMIQDSRGFLWISTSNGLYRFNGEYFDLFTTAQGLSSFGHILSLAEDRQGQIWAGTDKGIDIINLENGILKHLESSQGLNSNQVNSILEDSMGNVWVATEAGVNIIDPKSGTLKQLTRAQGLSQNTTSGLLEDDWGNIWIGTSGGGVNIVNQRNKNLKHLTTSEGLSNNDAWQFNKDKKGRILIGTNGGGVNIVDLKSGTFKRLGVAQGLSGDRIYGLPSDNRGHIWIAADTCVDIISVDSGEIRHLTTAEGLSGNSIDPIMIDNQGHVWMSNHYAEVDVMDLNGEMFKKLSTQQGLSNSYEDHRGRIWANNGGSSIGIVDMKAGNIKNIGSKQGLKIHPTSFLEVEEDQIWSCGLEKNGVYILNLKAGTLKHLTSANGLNSDIFWGLNKDRKGNIWLWGDKGVTIYDSRNKTFRHLTTAGGLSDNGVWACIEDDKGNIWIVNLNGIVDIIDPEMGTMKHLITGEGQSINHVWGLMKDGKGNILMNTNGDGFYIIDPVKGTLINFTTKEGLANNVVTILKEKNGSIYAGTNDGLTIFTLNNQSRKNPEWQIKTYGKLQLFDHVDFNGPGGSAALLTKNGQFWWNIGADGAIIMDEPSKKDTIIPPTYITGIDILEKPQLFANRRLFQNKPGTKDTIWSTNRDTFYVNGGMLADTGFLKTNHITWDSVAGPWEIPVRLRLPYDQNIIRFHFTGTHLVNPEKTRYRYILEGNDKSWSSINDKPFSDAYRNLSPGIYTFKVSSSGFNGIWSKTAEMGFTITPPWWQTWWAYSLYAISFTIALVEFIRWRTNKIRKESLLLEGKVLQRTKELKHSLEELRETQTLLIQQEKMASLGELTAGIAHEIQNPLNFMNNFSEVNSELIDEMEQEMDRGNLADAKAIAKDIKENERKINHHGKRADAIVKGMLQHSRSSSGVKEPTDINALADEYLRLAYHGLRAKDKSFNAVMKTDYDNNIGTIHVIPQDIGRVLLNLYNNAFYVVAEKKKQQGADYEPTVSVSTKKMGDKVLISVKDNGNGIPQKVLDKIFQPFFTTKPTGEGTGLGLSLSYDIIKAHGGELKVETKEGEFAEFIVRLPLI